MRKDLDRDVFFYEEQRYRQWWVWGPVAVSVAVPAIVVMTLALKIPEGSSAVPVVGMAVFAVASGALVILCFRTLKLVTAVRDDGIHLRFSPFDSRRITYDQIQSCQARRYRPVWEYGGWGFHWKRHGTAYNVSGNWGVQLELTNGKRLLIGSQRADELAQAIEVQMKKAGLVPATTNRASQG